MKKIQPGLPMLFWLLFLAGPAPAQEAYRADEVQVPPGSEPAERLEQHSELFESLQAGLFTVEVVDRASNNKNAQGSAFLVADTGLLATNYHVVSGHVLEPDRYSLRYRDHEGETGALEVMALDVLHDLALVRFQDREDLPAGPVFGLESGLPRYGQTLLALGNPYDIGVSIVPGTYNGLLEGQYRKNIHFTGALNPGMSGGPTVNSAGEVVGINVAGAGNSVSFLVPVENLRQLLARTPEQPQPLARMRERVVERIIEHQAGMVDELLAGDWSLEPFGPLLIPREIQPWISCSGSGRQSEEDAPWKESHSNCVLNDRIYLSRSLDTGPLEIIFGWYQSDQLNPFQFSRVFEQSTFMPFNRTGDDDVTAFECNEDWVSLPSLQPVPFKASYCLRAYLDYPGLYDVLYVARALMPDSEGLHVHYTLAGVGRPAARRFHDRLLGVLEWK
ncbi:MAG: serine protease [Wenzhouxiangellaceae bacterium]|nr:serine protease [Wenzhouxiangellaceae bacterium]